MSIGYLQKRQKIIIATNLNFTLKQGELTGIIGVNGIGKSTLLRTLAQVQPALAGTILLHNTPLERYTSKELASIVSIVLTETIPSKNLTVLELISLGRQPYTNWIGSLSTADKEKIEEAIEMVGLSDLQHKKCYELSDGQLQRVMIGRALAQDTELILLDEPTSHLDLYHKVQLLKLLHHVAHTTKKTILFTSHEIEIALQLCDQMLILNNLDNPFGSPETLISQKQFEKLFPTDTLRFDADTNSFKVS